MEGTGIQPVMSMNPGDGFGFGSEGLWLFAILALFGFGGNGFFGNRGIDGRAATVEDLNNSANFTRLESQVMNNGNRIEQKADAISNGICDLGYAIAQQFGNTNTQMSKGFCDLRYEGAMNTASINSTTTAQTQKILDALAQNKIESLRDRVNQLELRNAMCGVVKYPNSTTYSAGYNPFCGGICC